MRAPVRAVGTSSESARDHGQGTGAITRLVTPLRARRRVCRVVAEVALLTSGAAHSRGGVGWAVLDLALSANARPVVARRAAVSANHAQSWQRPCTLRSARALRNRHRRGRADLRHALAAHARKMGALCGAVAANLADGGQYSRAVGCDRACLLSPSTRAENERNKGWQNEAVCHCCFSGSRVSVVV